MADPLAALPDAEARRRIETDLDVCFLVEAGAGSGKTTSLVGRILALVRSGRARPGQIAAITFTRKAAAQLRERLQVGLEQALRAEADPAVRERLRQALGELDRCFVGTVHSFCARLLRERPVEAGLDPAFRELEEAEDRLLARAAWREYLEELRLRGDPALRTLDSLDLVPADLEDLYLTVVAAPDVTPFRAGRTRPDLDGVRDALARFLAGAEERLPGARPPGGWDPLQALLHRVVRLGRVLDLTDDRQLMRLLGHLEKKVRVIQNRWPDREAARAAEAWVTGFQARVVIPALTAWREYRQAGCVDFVLPAAAHYARRRRELGVMNFQDLLMGAAALLREHPHVRRWFAGRYPYILVDEFQDTDPVQAEILMLLAGEPATEPDWRRVRPRPGSLFVVGDPKQSIYRFRRADITVYHEFRERLMAAGGEVLTLTANFRSVPVIGAWVNPVVAGLLPAAGNRYQAARAPLSTVQPDPPPGVFQGVYTITVPPVRFHQRQAIAAADAERIAAFIA